jgi:hypothetical protein
MKESTKSIIIESLKISAIGIIIAGIVLAVALYTSYHYNDDKTFTIRNNSTCDYTYEHYCDSIYIVNPDYYLDVIQESDKYNEYLDEHGEWWTN